MAGERVDIEITDKVNPDIRSKVLAIAAGAREAHTAVSKLKSELLTVNTSAIEKLSAASAQVSNSLIREMEAHGRAQLAASRTATEDAKTALQKQRLATEIERTTAAQARAEAAAARLAAQQQRSTSVQDRMISGMSNFNLASQLMVSGMSASGQAAANLANQQNLVSTGQTRLAGTTVQVGQSSRLTSNQLQNLVFQLNDIFVSLASGQRFWTVMIQQGSQISTIFGPGSGVLGILKGVASGIASLVGPVTLFVGSIVGVIGALTFAWSSYSDTFVLVRTALAGAGRQVGTTTNEFIELTAAAADAGKVSKGFAVEFGAELAKTGQLGVTNITRIISITKDFAATVGTDIDKARETLVKTFTDPGKGIEQLNRQLNFLDASTLRYVNSLIAQGRTQDAINIALEKLPTSLAKADQNTTALGRTWDRVWTGAKNLVFATGQAIDRVISQEAEARLARVLSRIQTLEQRPTGLGALDLTDDRRASELAKAKQEAEELRAELAKLKTEAADRGEKSEFNRWTTEVQELIDKTAPAQSTVTELRNKLELTRQKFREAAGDMQTSITTLKGFEDTQNSLTRAIESGLGVRIQDIKSQEDLNNAIKAADAAGRNYFDTAQRKAALDAIDLQMINARSAGERSALARRREEITLAGQAIDKQQAEQAINQVGNQITQESIKTKQDELYEIERYIKTFGTVGPQRELQVALLEKELAARRANNALSPAELSMLSNRLAVLQQTNRVQSELDRIYQDIIKPAAQYNDTLKAATFLYEQGKISAQGYFNVVNEAKIKALEAQNTVASGLQAGFLQVTRDLGNVAQTVKQGVTNVFSSLENTFVDFAKTGKFNFTSFTESVKADIARLIYRVLILRSLMNGLSGLFGGAAPTTVGSDLNAGTGGHEFPMFAKGGMFEVGGSSATDTNFVSFMATRGERVKVQTPQQVDDEKNSRNGSNVSIQVVNGNGITATATSEDTANGTNIKIETAIISAAKTDVLGGGELFQALSKRFRTK